MRRLLSAAAVVAAVLFTGCEGVVIHRSGPPSHAPAWGVRAVHTHHYRYYPSYGVYYCDVHHDWCYCDGGSWVTVSVLPEHIVIGPEVTFVEIEEAGPAPYLRITEHRTKYPPGWKASPPMGRGKGRWK
ncbi:MAG: hypothetical protein HYY93_09810 [Planctomycetes bacterium]|nr:hypothetical protein [Planctomycetota bacterium]